METGQINEAFTNWDELVTREILERRCGKRLNLSFSIEVSGFDRQTGKLFVELTKTGDVSEMGCRFDLQTPVERSSVIAIKLLPPGKTEVTNEKPLLFEVVWIVARTLGWTVGARKLQNDKMWRVTFPETHRSSSEPPAK